LSGDDGTAAAAVAQGAKGVISVTANVVPEAMAQLMAAALRGDREGALRLDAPLRALHEALFVEANPIPVKWAMRQRGLIEGGLRLPLTELSETYHGRVRAALEMAEARAALTQAKSA
jgi:4-hydroxy-tetrahydrodipicolinate synthase